MIRVHSWPWLAAGLSLAGLVAFSFVNYHGGRVTDLPLAAALNAANPVLAVAVGFSPQRALRFWERMPGAGRRGPRPDPGDVAS